MSKIRVDSGGGFLKITTLSVQNTLEDSDKRGRQSYSDGVAAKSFKDAGVKKLILLGIVPSTQENYNVSKLWLLLQIEKLKGIVATDLKLANTLAGLMTHSNTYPCTWCTAFHGDLNVCGEYRAIADCFKNYKNYSDWLKAGASKKNSKNFNNCINSPLFEGDEGEKIIDFIPPPEPHLMLGDYNKIYDHMLQEIEGDSAAVCHLNRKTTHGRSAFAGNDCKSLLNKVYVLRSFVGCLKYV